MKRRSQLVILLLLVLLIKARIPSVLASFENFNAFTEVNPQSKLLRNSTHINWTDYRRNDTGRFYRSYGASHFLDFEQWFDIDFSIIEAGDIDNRAFLEPYILSTENDRGGTSNDTRLQLVQVGLLDNVYRVRFRQRSGGVVQFDNQSITISNIDPVYWVLNKSGSIWRLDGYSTTILREGGGDGDLLDYDESGNNDSYEFIILARGLNAGSDPIDYSSGWIQNLDFRIKHYVSFYHTSGGVLRVDCSPRSNASTMEYINGSTIELFAMVNGNNTYTFSHFTIGASFNISNPASIVVLNNLTVWTYYAVPTGGDGAPERDWTLGIVFGVVALSVALIQVSWSRKKQKSLV